jgi:predicted nucleotidyltransferase
MDHHGLEIDRAAIAEFCRRHHIRRLSLFGSILRGDFRPDSDVDFLVEVGSVTTPWFPAGLIVDLEDLLGRGPVDRRGLDGHHLDPRIQLGQDVEEAHYVQ